MRFLLLLGCAAAVCVLLASASNGDEPGSDSKDKGGVLYEGHKRTIAARGTKLSRDRRNGRKKPPVCAGCYTSLLKEREDALPLPTSPPLPVEKVPKAIKPTKKPRAGSYGPLRLKRDVEEAEEQSKHQKHYKREKGEKRREWKKKGDHHFGPQVEDSETMRDHKGHRRHRHREHKPFRKHSHGMDSPRGSSIDRIHQKDTEVEDSETMRDHRGHEDHRGHRRHRHREHRPFRKHTPGLYSPLGSSIDRMHQNDTEAEGSETERDVRSPRSHRHTENRRKKKYFPGSKGPLIARPVGSGRTRQRDTEAEGSETERDVRSPRSHRHTEDRRKKKYFPGSKGPLIARPVGSGRTRQRDTEE
ncbi:uncharacterized protein LOC134928666 isoform X2 [Pseudophryne corroboree]|uniref:uncharacterized protein LOC134928666 isoform X2 n=1 Tax=Pseudophryne corroboree TaxID=495146 RepID=UPI0030819336